MFECVQSALIAVSIVDAKGGEQFENLFLDGGVGRVESRGQFGHVLPVLDDVVESDSRIHDALDGRDALHLRLKPSPVESGSSAVTFHLLLHLVPTCWDTVKLSFRFLSKNTVDESNVFHSHNEHCP